MISLDDLKPQIDALNEMYRVGFEEGRRAAFREILPQIKALADHPIFNKNEGAETLIKQQGEYSWPLKR